jgi:NADPH:quinone reductase-like Zn-dependent oxidoreductase
LKAIVHYRYGSPDVLELADIEMPALDDDGVLVRIHGGSVGGAPPTCARGTGGRA